MVKKKKKTKNKEAALERSRGVYFKLHQEESSSAGYRSI